MESPYSDEALIQSLSGFSNHYADVNGTTLHYVSGGTGAALVLIPGYPETWWGYHKVMPLLAQHYQVIVMDVRGMGSSGKTQDGYDKKNMAKDVCELLDLLEIDQAAICGHDIGAHVAFSFAANYPARATKLIMLDTPHPDAGMYNLPMLPVPGAGHVYPWWLAFNQVRVLPEQLLEGRMRLVIDWLFDHLLQNKDAVSAFDKEIYANAYNSKDAIRASNAWYQAFPRDIEDMKTYTQLTTPVLGIGGSGFPLLEMSLPGLATDCTLKMIDDCGHFLLAEKAEETLGLMLDFLR